MSRRQLNIFNMSRASSMFSPIGLDLNICFGAICFLLLLQKRGVGTSHAIEHF